MTVYMDIYLFIIYMLLGLFTWTQNGIKKFIYVTVSAKTTHSLQNFKIELQIPSATQIYEDYDDNLSSFLRLTVQSYTL